MEQIYVITNDRFKGNQDEVTYPELEERVRNVDKDVQLRVETEGVYDAKKDELIAVPKEFVIQE